jgi:hypothetical protein
VLVSSSDQSDEVVYALAQGGGGQLYRFPPVTPHTIGFGPPNNDVRPLAGARIETQLRTPDRIPSAFAPSRGRGLKHVGQVEITPPPPDSGGSGAGPSSAALIAARSPLPVSGDHFLGFLCRMSDGPEDQRAQLCFSSSLKLSRARADRVGR